MTAGRISASSSRVGRPGCSIDRDIEFALLGVLLDFCVLDALKAGALEEALDRALRRADARALALLAPMRLRLGQADDVQRQPPRRREALRALIGHVRVDQRVGDQPLQIVRRLALHARRDFFAEEFKEQVGHSRSSLTRSLTTAPTHPAPHLPLPARGERGERRTLPLSPLAPAKRLRLRRRGG